MEIGMTNKITREVTEQYSAKNFGSGAVDVLATPAMIAFMEEAALKLVAPELESGKNTVGTLVNVKHLAPTPIGDQVEITAVLEDIDGKKLTFSLTAYDSNTKIGEGKHERFIINVDKFMDKLNNS